MTLHGLPKQAEVGVAAVMCRIPAVALQVLPTKVPLAGGATAAPTRPPCGSAPTPIFVRRVVVAGTPTAPTPADGPAASPTPFPATMLVRRLYVASNLSILCIF